MPGLTNVDAILRDDYKSLWENLNNAAFMLAQVTTKKDSVNGKIARHAVHVGRSGGIGARAENDNLPTADTQRFATVPVPIRWQTGRIQLTVQLMQQATGEPGAFADAMEAEMEGIKNDAIRDVNRQVWGTSNGVIATCGTTTASNTVQLAATTPLSVMRHLYIGRVVDIGTVASPTTIASGRTVTAVNLANRTITISGATVTTSGIHFVFNTSAGGATNNTGQPGDGQKELTGLQTIVAGSGVLHTVDPTNVPNWVAQSYTNSGTLRPLSETMLDLAIMQNQVESGKVIDVLVSNTGVYIAAKSVLSAYQRNIDTLDFAGGFKGIKWSTPGVAGAAGKELGWFADFDCPPNRVFGVNTSDGLVCHQVQEGWKWLDDDGAILNRVPNQLAFEATLYTSMELACVQRNSHFVIGDLIEATL